MSKEVLGILGAGDIARRTAHEASRLGIKVAFLAVSPDHMDDVAPPLLEDGSTPDIIDLTNPSLAERQIQIVAGVGAPLVRRMMIETWPGTSYGTVVAESSQNKFSASRLEIGEGTIIVQECFGDYGPVKLGKHVLVNTGVFLPTGMKVGDFVTIGQNSRYGANVTIEDGVLIGLGAIVRQGTHIGEGGYVGMGAVVTRPRVEAFTKVVGNPARPVNRGLRDWPDSF